MSRVVFFSLLLLIICLFFTSFSNGAGPPAGSKGPAKGPSPGAPGSKGPGPGKGPSPGASGPKGPGPGPGPVSSSDPGSLYKSFLDCLPTQSPQPDPSFSTIVYSSTANSSAYTKTLQDHIRNKRYNVASTPKPVIIATPKKESHVQAIVLCAKKLNIQIKIRSGGHDYEAISYVSSEKKFMILDMFNIRKVDINIPAQTAYVEAGAQLGDLYYRIWEKSKVHGFPSGVCPTIGVGGHLSGSGYGTMIRKYGLSIDHITDAKIVTANGKVMDRKTMGEDLFWALRGGSGSSFGVVLSFTVKLVSVPKVTTVFRIEKPVEQNAIDAIMKWQSIMPTIDNDLFIRLLLSTNKNSIRTVFIANFLGDSSRVLALMNKSFPELGVKKEDCHEVTWFQSLFYWAEIDYNKSKPEVFLDRKTVPNFFKRKSDYVQTPIQKAGWSAIFNKLKGLDKVAMGFNPYGGKMSEIAANATPMPHRAGNLYKIQYSINWGESDPKATENGLKQAKDIFEFMTTYVSKNPRGAFTNYRDFDIGVRSGDGFNSGKVYGEKYYKGNYERLVKIKTAVDPDNFFRNEQSIPAQSKKG
ncbi:hypothetical protein QVD17_31866 [Tagetes erecta]|uniref:FAD-binding PCMH-type domain-containing protein n=1 Tax=Tagetes erecta TaxID=13708 RepID=A0AAD8K6F6_TARER|nr:hypothetical protein QVD17_31866 [Tagetes erecta]